ncbi:MAG: hypothetical protein V4596_01950 [Bdellovibrionota bacterium]
MSPYFHLSIGVRSIESSVDFFTRVLTATVQHQDPSGYVNIDFFGTQITLKQNPLIEPNLPDLHFGINLGIAEFNQLSENILMQDPKCISMAPTVVDPDTKLERKKMYVKCPTGYLVEIKGYK